MIRKHKQYLNKLQLAYPAFILAFKRLFKMLEELEPPEEINAESMELFLKVHRSDLTLDSHYSQLSVTPDNEIMWKSMNKCLSIVFWKNGLISVLFREQENL